jgi:hypothetical protein
MKINKIFPVILSLIIVTTVISTSGQQPVYSEPVEESPFPALQIKKWISTETRIQPFTNVTVYVNITNFGNHNAYNLTIDEPTFEDWTVLKLVNYEEANWVQVDAEATLSYSYTFQFSREGNFVIENTKITYYDENSTQYESRSGDIFMEVFIIPPPPSLREQWQQLLLICSIIVALPIVLALIRKYVFNR